MKYSPRSLRIVSDNPYESPKETAFVKGRWIIPAICIGAVVLIAVIAFFIWLDFTIARQMNDYYFPKAAP